MVVLVTYDAGTVEANDAACGALRKPARIKERGYRSRFLNAWSERLSGDSPAWTDCQLNEYKFDEDSLRFYFLDEIYGTANRTPRNRKAHRFDGAAYPVSMSPRTRKRWPQA